MSPPASERAETITPDVWVTHTLRPSNGARTTRRAVPTATDGLQRTRSQGSLNVLSVSAGLVRGSAASDDADHRLSVGDKAAGGGAVDLLAGLGAHLVFE